MSGTSKILSIALVALLALFGYTVATQASVTGSFGTSVTVVPQSTDTETSKLDFDLENALDVTVALSGLSTSIHTHFGIAGMEDAIVTYAATLGALDVEGKLVFGRFGGQCEYPYSGVCLDYPKYYPDEDALVNNTTPQSTDLRFVKKRVESSMTFGGVSFSNLALVEDTALGYKWKGNTAIGFGDVITLEGQTPSGITVSATTGICAQKSANVIKKHWWKYSVNPDCTSAVSSFANSFTEDALTPKVFGSTTSRVEGPSTEKKISEEVQGTGNITIKEEVYYTDSEGEGTAGHAKISDGDRIRKVFTFSIPQTPSTKIIQVNASVGTYDPPESALVFTASTDAPSSFCSGSEIDDWLAGSTFTLDDGAFAAAGGDGKFTCTVEWDVNFTSATKTESTSFSVTFDEVGQAGGKANKPALFFDFEDISISGIPLATDLTASASVSCVTVSACSMTNTLKYSGGVVPITATVSFSDLLTLSFSSAKLEFSAGFGTLTLSFNSKGEISSVALDADATLNPDTHPATFSVDATLTPGTGLTTAKVGLSIERSGVTFDLDSVFKQPGNAAPGDPAEFDYITFGLGTTAGMVSVDSDARFNLSGLQEAKTTFTVTF